MKYKFIEDLTSDVMFEAYGKDLPELFENAAEAMFSVICRLDKVKKQRTLEIKVEGESPEALMIAWLQELISLVDTEEMFFSGFKVLTIKQLPGRERWVLNARVSGEPIAPEKGETVVKAVTYYKYKLEKTPEGYKARVSLDI